MSTDNTPNPNPAYRKYTAKQIAKLKQKLREYNGKGMKRVEMVDALNAAGINNAKGEEFNTLGLSNFINVHARRYQTRSRGSAKPKGATVKVKSPAVEDAVIFSRSTIHALQTDPNLSEIRRAQMIMQYLGD